MPRRYLTVPRQNSPPWWEGDLFHATVAVRGAHCQLLKRHAVDGLFDLALCTRMRPLQNHLFLRQAIAVTLVTQTHPHHFVNRSNTGQHLIFAVLTNTR